MRLKGALSMFLGLVAFAGVALSPGCDRSAEERPNVVLIIIDTLRADLLSCYGCPLDTSPEIDALAEEGVVFERVLSQCSWTRPSIGSMLTSLYPRSLGIYREKFDILADEYLTLAEILKDHGYRTIGITANPHLNKTFNFHQGFDDYAESSVIWGWMEPEEDKIRLREGRSMRLPRSGEILDWAMSQARSVERGPAYVQINVMEVHSPSLVLNRYRHLYDKLPVDVREDEPPKRKAALTHLVRKTHCAVTQLSGEISDFMDELILLPGWRNTLFVITSDHGQGLVDHPDVQDSNTHGNLLYDSQVRVPLILYNPSDDEVIPRGKRVKRMVRLLDVAPTLLDYAGIRAPEEMMGESLLALVTGKGEPPDLPEVFTAETNWRDVEKIAVYTERWKYIENRDGWSGVNRFELQADGVVENGALTDSVHVRPEEADRLRSALRRWEESHVEVDATQPGDSPTDQEIEQLRSLGYIK